MGRVLRTHREAIVADDSRIGFLFKEIVGGGVGGAGNGTNTNIK